MLNSLKPVSDEQLLLRIHSEYLEMPGLQLTIGQARRLFGLGEQICEVLLTTLVNQRLLARRPDGRYARPADGYADQGLALRDRPGAAVKRTA